MVAYWYKLVYVGMRAGTWICTSEYHTLIQVELRRWISQKKMEKGRSEWGGGSGGIGNSHCDESKDSNLEKI